MLLPHAPFSAPPADAPAARPAAPARGLGGLALSTAAVIGLVDASTVGGWLVATALAAGACAVLPADRPRRPARQPGPAAPGPEVALSGHELTERLRAMHDAHVEEVNLALAEGREDLVRESSDRYTDAALVLLTSPPHPAA